MLCLSYLDQLTEKEESSDVRDPGSLLHVVSDYYLGVLLLEALHEALDLAG